MTSKIVEGASSTSTHVEEEENNSRKSLGSADKTIGTSTTAVSRSRVENDVGDSSNSDNDSIDTNEMMFSLSSTTLETSNIVRRGRSRKRSSRKELRSKFVIESLYVEISELKRQNELLKNILENVQRSTEIQDSFTKLHLNNDGEELSMPPSSSYVIQQKVPNTVQVCNSTEIGGCSDLEISNTDRDWESHLKKGEGKEGSRGYDYTTDDAEKESTEEINRLLYS